MYTFIENVIVIYGLWNFRIHGLFGKSHKDNRLKSFYFEQAIGKLQFTNRIFLQVTQLKYVNGQGFTGVQVNLNLLYYIFISHYLRLAFWNFERLPWPLCPAHDTVAITWSHKIHGKRSKSLVLNFVNFLF